MPPTRRHARWQDEPIGQWFTLGEFASRDAPDRRPAPWQVGALRGLVREYLDPLRRHYGRVIVHSGIRTPAHNRAVGGAPQSYHLTRRTPQPAAGADVSCARGTPHDWFRLLDRLGAPGLGLYSSHVHVDNRRGSPARW